MTRRPERAELRRLLSQRRLGPVTLRRPMDPLWDVVPVVLGMAVVAAFMWGAS